MAVPPAKVPVLFDSVDDAYVDSAHIFQIIWEGATASGNAVEIRLRVTNELVWAARTDATQTYLGVNFGPQGISAPNGFAATILGAGRVLIYLG
jgi:hypothetical protein